jgi:cell wall-associated NlpC family hydrolase
MLVAGVTTPLILSSAPAGADQVATLQERAQFIAAEIQSANVKLQILDENYLQAKSKVAWLAKLVAKATTAIGRTEVALGHDRSHLRRVAIEAYVTGNASQSLSVLFNGSQQNAGMQQTYIQAASGNLNQSQTTVLIAQFKLKNQRNTLNHTETIAKANEHTISTDFAQAKSIAAQLAQEQAQVKGQLAQAVAAVQAAEAAAQAAALEKAAAAAAAAAQKQQQQEQLPPPPPPPPPVASGGSSGVSSGGSAAQIAVNAAQSQRGVPYVWGGATPGVGFDCSGLTMWAWGQAGVSLDHGATDQYYAIQHVSMSDLQPGDLIFYGDSGYLYHVVMYIGGGEVVQAEETGTNVMDTPLWPGAYGAGRP